MTALVIGCITVFLLIDTLYDLLDKCKASHLKTLCSILLTIHLIYMVELFPYVKYWDVSAIRYVPIGVIVVWTMMLTLTVNLIWMVVNNATNTKQ